VDVKDGDQTDDKYKELDVPMPISQQYYKDLDDAHPRKIDSMIEMMIMMLRSEQR